MWGCGLQGLPRWRKTGGICIAFAISVLSLLLALLCFSGVRAGSVSRAWIFFAGSCARSSRYNLMLHLLTNVVSTGILASSSFFMQVLNSPMRADVDQCHARGTWLDIGVGSFHNLRVLPRFRAISWAMLALTSIPIHLLANSAIFQTQTIESEFTRAIVAESLVYRNPQTTTLAFSASNQTCPMSIYPPVNWQHSLKGQSDPACDPRSVIPSNDWKKEWEIPMKNNGRWEEVSPQDCAAISERTCDLFRLYRAFVMVVQPQCSNVSENAPAVVTSRKCLSTACTVVACSPGSCKESCSSNFDMDSSSSSSWDGWNLQFGRRIFCDAGDNSGEPIPIKTCLAEKREDHCKLGISNPFLLVICLCILTKVALCIFVTKRLGAEKLLFVLGDAMESFISQIDRYTAGTSFLETWEVKRWSNLHIAAFEQVVHRWQGKRWRQRIAVSLRTWMAFAAFIAALVFFTTWLTVMRFIIRTGTKEFDPFSFSHGTVTRWLPLQTHGQFFPSVIFANSIQILLALVYLFLTSICTRYVMAREWATFSSKYRPLRVSEPKGDQLSTYFLELPWSFGIPITVTSIANHLLASNGIYVLVTEGGYLNGAALGLQGHHPDLALGLSEDMFIGVGFSFSAIIALIALVVLIVVAVLVLAFWRLPGIMPVVGSNSVAISSCCHVASWQWVHINDTCIRHLPGVSDPSSRITTSQRAEETRCLSKVKWGAATEIKPPKPGRLGEIGILVIQRLGFGVVADGIESPVEGDTYT